MNQIQDVVRQLTVNIRDLSNKPMLRPVLEAELLKMDFNKEDVAAALNETFKVTLQ